MNMKIRLLILTAISILSLKLFSSNSDINNNVSGYIHRRYSNITSNQNNKSNVNRNNKSNVTIEDDSDGEDISLNMPPLDQSFFNSIDGYSKAKKKNDSSAGAKTSSNDSSKTSTNNAASADTNSAKQANKSNSSNATIEDDVNDDDGDTRSNFSSPKNTHEDSQRSSKKNKESENTNCDESEKTSKSNFKSSKDDENNSEQKSKRSFEVTPNKSLTDFAGELPQRVCDLIKVLKTSTIGFPSYPKIALLYGPPGTGKTTLAEIIAKETNRKLFKLLCTHFHSKYYGENIKILENVFYKAKKERPSVIFIDEIDGILSFDESDSSSRYRKDLCDTLHYQLDLLPADGSVVCIGATNHYSKLDATAKTRMRSWCIEIPKPNEKSRNAIIQHLLNKNNIKADDDFINTFTKIANGLGGREIERSILHSFVVASRNSSTMVSPNIENLKQAVIEVFQEIGREKHEENPHTLYWTEYSFQPGKNLPPMNLLLDDIALPTANSYIKKIETFKNEFPNFSINLLRRLLLHGPAGTGKTVLIDIIRRKTKLNFIYLKGNTLANLFATGAKSEINKIFSHIKELDEPTLVYIDEIEKVISLFNQYIDLQQMLSIYLIGETNQMEKLSDSDKSKFESISFKLPDLEMRENILNHYLDDRKKAHLGDGLFLRIAIAMGGSYFGDNKRFSGRDIQNTILRFKHDVDNKVQAKTSPSYNFGWSSATANPQQGFITALIGLGSTCTFTLGDFIVNKLFLTNNECLLYIAYENQRQHVKNYGSGATSSTLPSVAAVVGEAVTRKILV